MAFIEANKTIFGGGRESPILRTFFSKIIEKNTFLIYSNQEYYCRLFRKVCFCKCPLTFKHQTSKIVLVTGPMRM